MLDPSFAPKIQDLKPFGRCDTPPVKQYMDPRTQRSSSMKQMS